ncbi:MAG: helix-turn-helix domain-containing protein [Reyranella sp.]|uniref:helix-turn-helix domain-containing protein n=1 Tax=Reyranella sp. TaxID=1929291 RepID=UPI0011F7614A|nr:helix-turn-helix domain-containing protein [Reyranella sp.]TAJ91238.1 MAG: helix-turn-helix domain-containing protein [Reyranella sp.]TBR27718.1 MAG: helix-turn-helix domain-containing protein [Reyranella sp.]
MKKPKPRPQPKARGFDGSAAARQRIETLTQPRPGTWSMLPAAAVCDRSLGQCTPLHVLAWLCKYRNTKTGECYPAIETMALDLGVSARSVQRHMADLIKCGHVVVVERRNRATGRQTSNQYYVLYGDVPALADREAAPQTEEEASRTQKAPGGPVMASDAGVTHDVTPEGRGVTHDVANGPGTPAGGVTHDVGGGVTHGVDPGDTKCHPNYPTCSNPLNDPSAEAGTLARAAAASDDAEGDIGKVRAATETGAQTQHEANQEGAVAKLPPRLASHLRVLSKTTGKAEAEFVAVIAEWHGGLVERGFDTGLALDRIVSEARRIPATAYAMENMRDGMARDLQAMRAAA